MRAVQIPALALVCAAVLVGGCTKQTSSTDTTTTETTSAPTTAADAAASVTATPVAEASPSAAATSTATASATTVAGSAVATSPQPAVSVMAVSFTDISGNYAQKAIVALGQIGALDATSGTFQPQKPILRREYVRWLFKTNNAVWADVSGKQIHPAEPGDKSDFTDLQTSDPDFKYIEGMNEAGISVGFPDKTFKADQPLTHEQAIAIKSLLDRGGVADRFKTIDQAIFALPEWKDKAQVSKAFAPAIATDSSDDNIFSIKIDNVGRAFGAVAMFRPQAPVTRAQAAMLLQVIGPHAATTNHPDEPRSVDAALHPKASPTP